MSSVSAQYRKSQGEKRNEDVEREKIFFGACMKAVGGTRHTIYRREPPTIIITMCHITRKDPDSLHSPVNLHCMMLSRHISANGKGSSLRFFFAKKISLASYYGHTATFDVALVLAAAERFFLPRKDYIQVSSIKFTYTSHITHNIFFRVLSPVVFLLLLSAPLFAKKTLCVICFSLFFFPC